MPYGNISSIGIGYLITTTSSRSNGECGSFGSVVEVILSIVIRMIMEPFVLDVPPFHRGLDAAVASEPLAIPAGPVDGVLVPVVDPVLIVPEYQNHAPGTV